MCFVGPGMGEVSTCELPQKVKKKEKVEVGDELGMFHFGGSAIPYSKSSNIVHCFWVSADLFR